MSGPGLGAPTMGTRNIPLHTNNYQYLGCVPSKFANGLGRVTLQGKGNRQPVLFTTHAVKSVQIDWKKLSFGLEHVGKTMYVATSDGSSEWSGGLQPYGPLPLYPSTQALHYASSIFEGLKAQESVKGRIVLFRPDENALRMKAGAERMCMPVVPTDHFVNTIMEVIRANKEYVPPYGMGSLYIRPLLFGSGPQLGLAPAPSYTFLVFCAAVGSYFKTGQLTPISLKIETEFHRAAPKGGMGGTKAAGNYSQVLQPLMAAKEKGYSDCVYLDSKEDRYLEEVSSCNIFIVKGNIIKTPPLLGTILGGVTRKSIIDIARSKGFTVLEERVSIEEAMQADEVFTSGTAVVICSVGSLTYRGHKKKFGTKEGEPTPIALDFYNTLKAIQTEVEEDTRGWVVPVC